MMNVLDVESLEDGEGYENLEQQRDNQFDENVFTYDDYLGILNDLLMNFD